MPAQTLHLGIKRKLSIVDPPMADKGNLRYLRKILGENQTEFWSRFGVSQSSGSRFEQGMPVPASVQILMHLYLDGRVTDHDLAKAILLVDPVCE